MIGQYVAFAVLCLIALIAFVRGYQRWTKGKSIQAVVLAFIFAYMVLCIVLKLKEWS